MDQPPAWIWHELGPILDAEVDRLPEKYRRPFVLCYLEGRTNEQTAVELGCPVGTVRSRLSRARERLRGRLTRRGLALSATALAATLDYATAAEVPAALCQATLQSVAAVTASTAAAASIPAQVAVAVEHYLRAQRRQRLIQLCSWLLFAIVAGVLLVMTLHRQHAAQLPVLPADVQALHGTWDAIHRDAQGQLLPNAGIHLTFQGNEFFFNSDLFPQITARYELDPTQIPKAITFYSVQSTIWPGTWYGIYALEGDTLKLCLSKRGAGRPAEFATDVPKQVFAYRLERRAKEPNLGDGERPVRD